MFSDQRERNARWMMRAGLADGAIEKHTGLGLERLLFLRATIATQDAVNMPLVPATPLAVSALRLAARPS